MVRDRVARWLQAPNAPAWIAALAVVLSLPSLGLDLQTDDHLVMMRLDEGATPLELFTIDPARLRAEREHGLFAWWTSPDLEVRFFRPLAALTHAAEHALWPDAAWAMHLGNALLYGLLAAVAALLYRQVLGAGVTAGLAALLYAVDEGHAFAVGWISSRNTLLAALFALLALLLHARSRERPAPPWRIAGPLCTALSLLSAELGLSALALLVAHACILESGPAGARLRGLAPHAAIALLWGGAYAAFGGGVRATGWYRDVRAEPLAALLSGIADLPLWLLSQLGPSAASAAAPYPAAVTRPIALALVIPIVALLWPALRASRPARFFALAMLLCVVPLWTTMPQDRVLVCASFGAFGWIAVALAEGARTVGRAARAGTRALATVHLVMAPVLFVPGLRSLEGMDRAARALSDALAGSGPSGVVLLNAPLELLATYATVIHARANGGGRVPVYLLHAGSSELVVQRVDDRTLEIEARAGWGRVPFERLFASEQRMRSVERAETQALRARVVSRTPDGRPLRVRFEWPAGLDAPDKRWLIWNGAGPVDWKPPPTGTEQRVPAIDVLASLRG